MWKGPSRGRSREGRALTLHKAAACSYCDRGGQNRSHSELGLRRRHSKCDDDRGSGGRFRGGGGGELGSEAEAGAAYGLLLVELLLVHDHRLACARGRACACACAGVRDCYARFCGFVRRAVCDQDASHARALSGVRAACVRVCVRTYDCLEIGNDRAHKTIATLVARMRGW